MLTGVSLWWRQGDPILSFSTPGLCSAVDDLSLETQAQAIALRQLKANHVANTELPIG